MSTRVAVAVGTLGNWRGVNHTVSATCRSGQTGDFPTRR